MRLRKSEVASTAETVYEIPETEGLVAVPGLSAAADMAEENLASRQKWDFEVAGVDAREFVDRVRDASLDAAARFCRDAGIPFEARGLPVVVTGHQPAFFHPGVWVKNFALDDLARRLSGTGLNLIVDSDVAVGEPLEVPSWDGKRMEQTTLYFASGSSPEAPYESLPVLPASALDDLAASALAALRSLPDPAPSKAFERFGPLLSAQIPVSDNLGQLLATARRAYEQDMATAYLELPVSLQSRTREFVLFFLSLAERIEEFQETYNAALEEYRERYDVRSAAHPFPALSVDEDLLETPFWLVDPHGHRATLWLKRAGGQSLVCQADGCTVELARGAYDRNLETITLAGVQIRPKALALTMFNRLFVADLFIHGFGGAKYDRVTDGIIRRFFGIEPPEYLAVTATVRLPTGLSLPSPERITELRHRLHAIKHNPDRFAGDDSIPEDERGRFGDLVERKNQLVDEIERPGAQKKSLGRQIREVNVALEAMLGRLAASTVEELSKLDEVEESRHVAGSREWPFCYFEPRRVHELVDHAMRCE